MKDDNYYVVHGWMRNKLGLKGNELLIYSIIHGFSQDGEGRYTGSLKYIQEGVGASKSTVMKSLDSLVEKNLIIKIQEVKNNIRFNEYYVNHQYENNTAPVENNTAPSIKTTPQAVSKQHRIFKEDVPINNKGNNKFSFKNSLIELGVKEYTVDQWLQVRKSKKAVNTELAFMTIKREIEKCRLSADECVQYAVQKSWAGFESSWIKDQNQTTSNNGFSRNR